MGPHGIGGPTDERIDVNSISEGVLSGVGQTFLVAAIGLVGRLLGVIGDRTIRELTRVTIVLLLPCFLFEAVLRDFHWAQLSDYGLMVAAALGMLAAGLALGWEKISTALSSTRKRRSGRGPTTRPSRTPSVTSTTA